MFGDIRVGKSFVVRLQYSRSISVATDRLVDWAIVFSLIHMLVLGV